MLITKRVCDMCKQEVEDGARAIFSPSAGANDYDLCPACARKIEVFIKTGSARTANMSFGNTTLPSNTTLEQPTGKPHEGGLDGSARNYPSGRKSQEFDKSQPNFYASFTPQEENEIWKCRVEGGDYEALAKKLGRSVDSIRSKVNRLAHARKGNGR